MFYYSLCFASELKWLLSSCFHRNLDSFLALMCALRLSSMSVSVGFEWAYEFSTFPASVYESANQVVATQLRLAN